MLYNFMYNIIRCASKTSSRQSALNINYYTALANKLVQQV